jgi:hypothetical protein
MSKYIPLFWDWRQKRALFYRIYINIFGIFLRIPILPMSFSWKWKTFDIYYRGDDLICFWKKGKLRYQSLGCNGEFRSLKEVREFWKRYFKHCEELDKNEN